MISEASVQAIEASPGWKRHRVEFLDLPEGSVVVKGQRPPRSPWLFRALSTVSSGVGHPLLKPVPAPGGAAAQATELRRLRELRVGGVAVPEVLFQTDRYIVLARVPGVSFQTLLGSGAREASQAVVTALDGLCDLHRRKQYLSQAFARNMLWSDSRVVYIDFEDDPLQVMELADAQARDLLSFMLSAVWNCRAPTAELMAAWQSAVRKSSPDVVSRVRGAVVSLAWLRHLPSRRRPWGRDIVTVQALAEFMTQWIRSTPVTLPGH